MPAKLRLAFLFAICARHPTLVVCCPQIAARRHPLMVDVHPQFTEGSQVMAIVTRRLLGWRPLLLGCMQASSIGSSP